MAHNYLYLNMNKRSKLNYSKVGISTIKQFKELAASPFRKMKVSHTTQTALKELKEISKSYVTNTDRMNALISVFAEQIEQLPLPQRKDILSFFGIMGEIFEDSLIPFIEEILGFAQRWLEDSVIHLPLSISLGSMMHHVFKSLKSQSEIITELSNISAQLFAAIKNCSINVQIGIGMCITKLIQNSPIDPLIAILNPFSTQLIELIQDPTFKCQIQVFETLISLVLAVENEFEPYVDQFIPILLDTIQAQEDWMVVKMSIDVIYTFVAFLSNPIKPNIKEIVNVLKECKNHKEKHVREAAKEALIKIKEIYKDSPKTKVIESVAKKSILKNPKDKISWITPKSRV